MAARIVPKTFIPKAEDVAEAVYNKTRLYLPTLARLCLLSTFLDSGLRMCFEFSYYASRIDERWECGGTAAFTAQMILTISQLVGSVMIATQRKVSVACGILCALVFLKPISTTDVIKVYDIRGVYRDLANVGNLLMLLAQNLGTAHSLFAGVPTLSDNKPKNYLQLSGRFFLLFIFLNIFKYEFSFVQILKIIVGTVLIILVIVGYKTKLTALLLIVVLVIYNFFMNSWWFYSGGRREFNKFKFFHTFSAIGGLFLVVLHGPGGISLDETKKKW